jgi:hypothetical protein
MGIAALIVGIIGILCGAMGVITSFDILDEPVIEKLGYNEFFFWFYTAGILLLASIALLLGYKKTSGD